MKSEKREFFNFSFLNNKASGSLSPLQEKRTKKETVRQRCEFYSSQIPDIFFKVPKTKGIKVKAHVRSGYAESIMYIL
jgi:hypothetical protein